MHNSAASRTSEGRHSFSERPLSYLYPSWLSEIENLGFRGHIDQMGPTVQLHVGEEFGFVHTAIFRTGRAYADFDLVFHQVGQVVVGAVSGDGLDAEVPVFVSPRHAIVNEKHIHMMALGMGNLRELTAAGQGFVVILAEYEQKIGHLFLLSHILRLRIRTGFKSIGNEHLLTIKPPAGRSRGNGETDKGALLVFLIAYLCGYGCRQADEFLAPK
jgi:hypothetical protein